MEGIVFNNKKYLKIQAEKILERINQFDNKLYIEFGGKLFDDYHASRVLPGFEPDAKVQMFHRLKDQTEFIIVVNSEDIQSGKSRNDNSSSYESEVFSMIKSFKSYGIKTGSIVVTRYQDIPSVEAFKIKAENMGYKVYRHYKINDYPYNVDHILSDDGFGKNEFVETKLPLVVVTAPGPGSGKMATCLSQLYHESIRGIKAGYAKYETFPIWNLPLKHPVNLAYEAATADLKDVNMIDPFHLEAYGEQTVNYNRDIEVFPVLKTIFERIYGDSIYKSPTDMGVNMCGFCIEDEEACKKACEQEIIRRYYEALVKYKIGKNKRSAVEKIQVIMNSMNLSVDDRKCAAVCLKKSERIGKPCFAMELNNGNVVTGKESKLLTAASACILNALKELAGIDHDQLLLSPELLSPIAELNDILKVETIESKLQVNEVLIVLATSAQSDVTAKKAFEQLSNLKGTQGHSSKILTFNDELFLKKLQIQVTESDVL